ncbi:MAG: ATP-binding protein [Syntrophales bacterium]|jgi:DNA transposition AAA+ family ATPase|nr:ATP-binding protein [Syntrophales bacterium]
MNNAFISTPNITKFNTLCQELEDPMSMIGPSLAMITGPAGRGKSEAARHYAIHSNAIYIPPMNTRTPTMVLREIAFELAKIRPSRSEACLEIIGSEMAKERRIVFIDEADLLPMPILEMLRNMNERYACPVVLIGEDELKGKIESRRRLSSRIRRRMEFPPVSQQDVAFFFKTCLGLILNAEVTAAIHKEAKGDWRPVLTTAIGIERAMKASGLKECSLEMASDVLKHKNA